MLFCYTILLLLLLLATAAAVLLLLRSDDGIPRKVGSTVDMYGILYSSSKCHMNVTGAISSSMLLLGGIFCSAKT